MDRSAPHRRLYLESLECRRLLAADFGNHPQGGPPGKGGGGPPEPAGIELESGVLTITGSKKSDRISITSDGTNLTVKLNKQTETFLATDVTLLTIDGGRGNDRIDIPDDIIIDAVITGGAGNDRISAGGGADNITGDAGNDWLWGGGGDDLIDAGNGNDKVFGEVGNDELIGGVGNDALDGGEGDDTASGGNGHDRIRGGAGDDQLFGEAGKDQLYGDDGNDFLDGGDDKDKLFGGEGDDLLLGGDGNDHLNGGPGNNQLDGGEGNDKEVNGTPVDFDQVLSAALVSATDLDASGTATFAFTTAEGAPEFELNVTVTGYTASSMLDVSVGGTVIGQITTDASGNGTFTASTSPTDADEALIPGSVSIEAGTIVLVSTDLTGTLAAV